MVRLEKNEGGGKDKLAALLDSNFFGIVTLNMLAGRDSRRCSQSQGEWSQGS